METNTEFVKEVRDWFAEWKEQDKTFGFHQGVKYAMQACDRIEQQQKMIRELVRIHQIAYEALCTGDQAAEDKAIGLIEDTTPKAEEFLK